jgi:hypothetical protein
MAWYLSSHVLSLSPVMEFLECDLILTILFFVHAVLNIPSHQSNYDRLGDYYTQENLRRFEFSKINYPSFYMLFRLDVNESRIDVLLANI